MNYQADLVSVVLPVYNGVKYLPYAIDSILAQTYSNFELIVINDGSKDATQLVIDSYADKRIRAFEQANMGLAATLNKGVLLSRGRWIARQDHDDVSLPNRLAMQVDFMNTHPAYAMVGAAAQILVEQTKTNRFHSHPCADLELRAGLIFYNYFVHSAVMFDKLVFDRLGGYTTDINRQPPEDYELWSRIAREYPVGNLPDVLLYYREVESSLSRDGNNPFAKKMILLTAENIAWATGESVNSSEVQALAHLMHRSYPQDMMENFGWKKAKNLFDRVMIGLASKIGVNQSEIFSQNNFILKQLYINYLDFLVGGRLSKLFTGQTREKLKKILRITS